MLIRRELLLVLSHYTLFCGASNNDAAANPLVRKRGSGLRGRSSYADADAFDFDPYLGVPRELKPDEILMMEMNEPLLSMSYDTKFPTSAPPPPIDALATPTPTCMKTKQPAPAPIDALASPTPTNMQQQQQQDTPTPAPIDALTTPSPTYMQQQQQVTPAVTPAPMDALTTPTPTCNPQHQQQQDAPSVDSLTTPPPTSIQQQQQQEAPTPAPMDALTTPTPTCIPQHQQQQQDTPAQAPMDALTTPPPTYMKQQQQDTPAPAPIVDALTTPPPTSMQQQQQETPASAPAPMDALTTPPPTCIQQPCMHQQQQQQQQTACSWKFYHQCAFKMENGVLMRTSNSSVTFGVTSAQPDVYSTFVSFFKRPKKDDMEYEIISTGSQVYPTNQNITESKTFTYSTNGYYELGYNVTFGEGSGYCTNKTVGYLGWIYFDDDSCSFGNM